MSDSFADLWNSTAPSKPQKSVPISQQKPSYTQPKPKQDVFALLSSAPSTSSPSYYGTIANANKSRSSTSLIASGPGSRPITPSLSSTSTLGLASRPASSLSSSSSKPASTGDAFSDLLSGSLVSNGRNSSMTIAERAALAEKERLASAKSQTRSPVIQEQWAGLDSLGGSFGLGLGNVGSAAPSKTTAIQGKDDWGLGDFGAPSTAKPSSQAKPRHYSQSRATAAASESLLDLDGFTSSGLSPATAVPPSDGSQDKQSKSLWDLDDFADQSPIATAPTHSTSNISKKEQFDSPDFDFNFGNREDSGGRARDTVSTSLLEDHDIDGSHHHHGEDEDDILGMLSKPVDAVRAKQQVRQGSTNGSLAPSSSSSSRSTPQRRPSPLASPPSPPPHVLGQLIEMGFSIPQAKQALAKTETGVDVQAALEMLLAGGDDAGGDESAGVDEVRPQRRFEDERRVNDPDQRGKRAPQRDRSPSPSVTPNIQEQADKILAQASEIGLSVLNKASLFWNQGKDKVQKAYEERAGAADRERERGGRTNERDTRPKWMQDADHDGEANYGGGFKDDHEDGEQHPHDYEPSLSRDRGREDPSANVSRPSIPPRAQPEPELELFGSSLPPAPQTDEPKIYVSPYRRRKPVTSTFLPTQQASTSSHPYVAKSRAPPPPSKPKPKRHLPVCPSSSLPSVRKYKTAGTDAFKLGQYSAAAEEYSKAIELLPESHLLLVPLFTNRALARLKCGECKGAVQDAAGALDIIGRSPTSDSESKTWETWHPADEDGGWEVEGGGDGEDKGGYGVKRPKGDEWNDTWGRGVDLRDGWVKAVRRRAEALEGMEKWSEARKDWEVLAGGGSGGWVDGKVREEAVRGLGRCKKMKMTDSGGASSPTSSKPVPPKVKPRPRPAPPASSSAAPSAAVQAYRAQINAVEAEDALKHQLKDTVDTRLLGWKKGKETNLRALLASLDTVLWEEVIKDMGGKPGLADLVSNGGVKKWYMKAVGRVHPDKLNASNSTVEQRMLAGGVFGALNEAWIAFK